VRTNANVPHIFGPTDEDVFFGLGFAHAQDRLWQMTLMRRTAQGRLSEIFGARTAASTNCCGGSTSTALPRNRWPRRTPKPWPRSRPMRAGQRLARPGQRRRAGAGAPEFFLFDPEIAVWQPADSLAIIKLMGLQLSAHLESEVLRARASLLLRPERVRDILPDDPGQGVAALPDFASLFPGLVARRHAPDIPADPLSPFPAPRLCRGVERLGGGPETVGGRGALLANDPHLGFTAPAIWYLARLELQSGGVIGGTIPGMPAILAGSVRRLRLGADLQLSGRSGRVHRKGEPRQPRGIPDPRRLEPFETRRSIVTVKDASR
jgi:penicillin G amidase